MKKGEGLRILSFRNPEETVNEEMHHGFIVCAASDGFGVFPGGVRRVKEGKEPVQRVLLGILEGRRGG